MMGLLLILLVPIIFDRATALPAECCQTPSCSDYHGTKAETSSGRKCQPWASDSPHKRSKELTVEILQEIYLRENFCRNPNAHHKAWCYTMDEEKRYEECDIRKCKASDFPQCKGELNRAEGGKAYAKSEADTKTAAMAFKGSINSGEEEWHSTDGEMPQWLLYELKEPLPVCKFSFRPRNKNLGYNRVRDCPKSYRFEGSNDNVTFTPLFTMVDENISAVCYSGETIAQFIPENKVEPFKFYRFFVVDVKGRGNGNKYATFGNLQFFSFNDANPIAGANGKNDTQLASTGTKGRRVDSSLFLLTWAHLLARQLSRLY